MSKQSVAALAVRDWTAEEDGSFVRRALDGSEIARVESKQNGVWYRVQESRWHPADSVGYGKAAADDFLERRGFLLE